MIVVRLMGGMGNQLFQYAAARALSYRHDAELRYDLAYMGSADQGTVRYFELHHFRCVGRPLSPSEDLCFGSQFRAPLHKRCLARVARAFRPHRFYEEPGIACDPSFLGLPDDTVLVGRFQSPLYFEGIADLLRKELQLSCQTSVACRALCKQALMGASVGLHVRRTDYVNNEAYRDVIQALPLNYYERALERIYDALGQGVQLHIVSDDIAWCREQALFRNAHTFVELSNAEHPHIEEFEVLRHCRHFVISNSTFAWWAAWLSNSPNKIVIAPEQWAHNSAFESPDRVPPSWARV